jgi:hypothetical protein
VIIDRNRGLNNYWIKSSQKLESMFMHYFFQKLPHPNSMMRFDLTTHNSIGGDDTTRPRRQGVFLHTFIPNIIRQCKLSYKLQHYHAHLCEPPKSLHPGGNRTVDLLFLRGLRRHWATPPGQVCTTLISASCTECAYFCSHRVSVFSKFFSQSLFFVSLFSISLCSFLFFTGLFFCCYDLMSKSKMSKDKMSN